MKAKSKANRRTLKRGNTDERRLYERLNFSQKKWAYLSAIAVFSLIAAAAFTKF